MRRFFCKFKTGARRLSSILKRFKFKFKTVHQYTFNTVIGPFRALRQVILINFLWIDWFARYGPLRFRTQRLTQSSEQWCKTSGPARENLKSLNPKFTTFRPFFSLEFSGFLEKKVSDSNLWDLIKFEQNSENEKL